MSGSLATNLAPHWGQCCCCIHSTNFVPLPTPLLLNAEPFVSFEALGMELPVPLCRQKSAKTRQW